MISLLRAEVRRLTSRRLARILALCALGLVVLVVGRAFLTSNRNLDPVAEQRAAAQAEQFRAECKAQLASRPGESDFDCDRIQASNFLDDPRLHATDALPEGTKAIAVGTALLAFAVGASYVGADWNAGTMQALLFWEPRRGRVLLAKAVALVVVAVAFMLVMQAFVYGVTMLTASTRGTTEGATAGFHVSNLLTVLRGAAFVSATSLLGFGVAGLARHTGASLGVAFGYFAVLENLLRGLRPGWQRFLFSENIAAILEKKIPVTPAHARSLGEVGEQYTLTGGRGAVTLTIYLGILLGAFYVTFTRRDVT